MFASKLSLLKGKRLNLNETIDSIIDIAEKASLKSDIEKNELDQDRKEFLNILKHKIKGAGPEDYKPYDFEDISSF